MIDPNRPEGVMMPERFRAYLVAYPERDEFNIAVSGTELKPKKLAGGTYRFPNGQRMNLDSCKLFYCNWYPGANMEQTSARDSRWQYIELPQANLSGADFTHTTLWYVSLNDSNLQGIRLTNATIDSGTSYRADMRKMTAIGSQWNNWGFGVPGVSPDNQANHTDMRGVDFTNARFESCTFHLCRLTDACFRNCQFRHCMFDPYPISENIDFTGAIDLNGFSRFPPPNNCLNDQRPRTYHQ